MHVSLSRWCFAALLSLLFVLAASFAAAQDAVPEHAPEPVGEEATPAPQESDGGTATETPDVAAAPAPLPEAAPPAEPAIPAADAGDAVVETPPVAPPPGADLTPAEVAEVSKRAFGAFQGGSWLVGIAAVWMLLVWGYRKVFADKVPTAWVRWVTLFVAVTSTVAYGVVFQTPAGQDPDWATLIWSGVVLGLSSMGTWDTVSTVPGVKKSVAAPPPGV